MVGNVNNNCANNMLHDFLKSMPDLYSRDMMTFNFYCLLHLAEDARVFKSLENENAFKFENYLQHLKKIIRKGSDVCAQLYNRLV